LIQYGISIIRDAGIATEVTFGKKKKTPGGGGTRGGSEPQKKRAVCVLRVKTRLITVYHGEGWRRVRQRKKRNEHSKTGQILIPQDDRGDRRVCLRTARKEERKEACALLWKSESRSLPLKKNEAEAAGERSVGVLPRRSQWIMRGQQLVLHLEKKKIRRRGRPSQSPWGKRGKRIATISGSDTHWAKRASQARSEGGLSAWRRGLFSQTRRGGEGQDGC